MMRRSFLAATMILAAFSGTAGTLTNGVWQPGSNCGTKPEIPVMDESTLETYNQSIIVINDWQQKVNRYNTCLVNEANTDSALIVKTANDQQNQFKAAIEKISKDIAAAKAGLNGDNTPAE